MTTRSDASAGGDSDSAAAKLQESQERYRLLWETTTDAVVLVDADIRIQYANPAVHDIFGYRPEELVGQDLAVIQPPRLREGHRRAFQRYLDTGVKTLNWRAMGTIGLHQDGHEFPVEIAFSHMRIADETVFAGFIRDVTQRKEHEDKIARLSRIYAVLSGINSALVRIHDRQELFQEACRIAVAEGAFKMAWIGTIDADTLDGEVVAWFGGTQADIDIIRLTARAGTPYSERPASRAAREKKPVICNDIATEPSLAPFRDALLERGYHSVAAFPLIVDDRAVAVIVLIAAESGFFDEDDFKLLNELAGDISFGLQYIEKEERLNYLAYYDALTDLPNRNLLSDRLAQAIKQAHRSESRLALLFLDLDGFKRINDSFGHPLGDSLLRAVARRLRDSLRASDTVARHGGDEFIVLLMDINKPEDAGCVANRLLQVVSRPFVLGERELYVTWSIGACVYPGDGEDIETLLKNADTALYRAKEEGGNGVRFYASDMGVRALERVELEGALRRALERGEFALHYQPKVDLATARIMGAEALLRWQSPQWGPVPTSKFIPVTEETGLIVPIGEWVLTTACAQIKEWRDAGLPSLTVSVNVSARQFRRGTLGETIANTCRQAGLDPRCLELELTESMVMHDVEDSIPILNEWKTLGIQLSLDDFGTGYSSLAYLRRFPFDRIKIDKSFVHDIGRDPDNDAIVRLMISLGHSLGRKVIAEGVETTDQLAFLRAHGCDEVQGYLISHPLPVAEFVAFVQRGDPLA